MKRILITVLTVIIGTSLLFAQTTIMRTDLRSATFYGSVEGFGYLPATDPYSGQLTVKNGLPENMVDWVLVELRATAGGSTIAQAVGCLMSDGSVTDTTGVNGLTFEGLESNTPYYIVVKHRNHVPVMSATSVQIDDTNTGYEYDFTTGNNYGAPLGQSQIGSNYAMISGDGDGNGWVQTSDKNLIEFETGTAGYKNSDYNLNAFPQITDKNMHWEKNTGTATQVPFQ